MDRGAWRAIAQRAAELDMTEAAAREHIRIYVTESLCCTPEIQARL